MAVTNFQVKDEDEFKKLVADSADPIIVDFFATWCGPCKVLGPILESVVDSFGGKIKLAKVDVDDLQEVAMEYGVEAMPTVIAMKGGKVTDKFVGMKDEATVKKFIEKALA